MIQRIQSLYILIAWVLTLVMFFFPLISITCPNNIYYQLWTNKLVQVSSNGVIISSQFFVLAYSVFILFMLALALFSFKNRIHQMFICKVNISLLLILFIIDNFYIYKVYDSVKVVHVSFGYLLILPLISAVLCLMANNAIKKDEELVKSVDRLR